jgi:anaerobic selenocysteine-containing dehydrogenase
MPQHVPSWEGYNSSELYEKYPLQLISPHPRYSFHTMGDGKDSWINDIKDHRVLKADGRSYWIIRMNTKDAESRNIEDGALVKAFNERGEVILAARLTERVPPGTVHSYESCADYEPSGSPGQSPDLSGCINILTPKRFMGKDACGMAPNSCLIQVTRLEGGTL